MNNPNKTKAFRLLGEVDVTALRKAVSEIPEEVWKGADSAKPNKFKVLDQAQHIVFRFIESFQTHEKHFALPLWDQWKDLIIPVIEEATIPYGYSSAETPRVMLARLKAGGKIAQHIDGAPAAQFPHKIHVPLFTNEDCFFFVDGRRVHMPLGEAYEVNNNIMHSAVNGGATDRIHLIFEYFPR